MFVDTAAKMSRRADTSVANVHAFRASFAEYLTRENTWVSTDELSNRTNALASAKGAAEAWTIVQMLLERCADIDTDLMLDDVDAVIKNHLTRKLLRGADDTWSGRGNDAKRSEFDGFREAAERIMDMLDY